VLQTRLALASANENNNHMTMHQRQHCCSKLLLLDVPPLTDLAKRALLLNVPLDMTQDTQLLSIQVECVQLSIACCC
jgi:hypothetical protein